MMPIRPSSSNRFPPASIGTILRAGTATTLPVRAAGQAVVTVDSAVKTIASVGAAVFLGNSI